MVNVLTPTCKKLFLTDAIKCKKGSKAWHKILLKNLIKIGFNTLKNRTSI